MTVPGQDPAAPAGETPANPPAQPATPPASQGADGEAFDAERARRTIENQRAKERELMARLKELEPMAKRLQELEDANKSELEKAQARATALEQQLQSAQAAHRDALIRAAVEREAHTQGAVKADVIYRLVDRSGIELDDAGEVKGADRAVKALLDAEPYLKGQPATTTPVPGAPKPTGSAPSRDQLIQKTREEMAATGKYVL
jgi:hypothetical protein